MDFSKFLVVAKTKKRSLNSAKIVSLQSSKYFKLRTKIIILCTLGLVKQKPSYIRDAKYTPLLVMIGGDPYIRALVRTISESEANDSHPYNLIYGGKQISDLSRHPNQRITFVSDSYKGECSSRSLSIPYFYQITSTRLEKVHKYHPKQSKYLNGNAHSFRATTVRRGGICLAE